MRRSSYNKKDFRSRDNRKSKDIRRENPDWKERRQEGENKTSDYKKSDKPENYGKSFRPKQNPWPKDNRAENSDSKENRKSDKTENFGKPFRYKRKFKKNNFNDKQKSPSVTSESIGDGSIRLNRYIANAGICSRREADELIAAGVVSVNGKVVTEMGYKVKPADTINYGGQTLRREKMVYVLLNKPKNYITTVDDPQSRKTVMELLRGACKERIYPVGRLDRMTTGLLLLTNDGELTKRLTHPRYGIKKIYHVVLDKNLRKEDFDKIVEGIELEDGPIKVDEISYVGEGYTKKEIGIELHSGRNRIVRRIFEQLGYNIIKLDRVYFAGLTKKDLPKGRWRHLKEEEIGILKMTAK